MHRIELRIEPRTGPAGESWTTIRRGRDVTVDHTDAEGRLRRFKATLASGVYDRIVGALRDAGFPQAPREKIGSDGFRVLSSIEQGAELRTRPMPYRSEDPGFAAVFALLDAVIAATSAGVAAPLTPDAGMLVTGPRELKLFEPTAEADEPPLGEDANDVVAAAWKLAIEHKHREVTAVHLLAALAIEHGYHLARLGLEPERVRAAAEALFTWDPEPSEPVAAPAFELVPDVARRIAADDGAHEAGLRHLLRALLQAGGADTTRILQKNRLPDALAAGRTRERIFSAPAPAAAEQCPRCGAPFSDTRWCTGCGRALVAPASFDSGSALDKVSVVIERGDASLPAGAVSRPLCTPEDVHVPRLTFHIDGDELVTDARRAALGVDSAELERAALRGLARVAASWTPRWVPDSAGREVDVLFCSDEPQASERILEKPFLIHAQSMLGTQSLAAAVPQRGMLVVTRLTDLPTLMALARHYFERASAEPLSPWGFAIQDGDVSGPIASPEPE
jgi:hypothetical protein